jgi:hypothetical protein
MEEQPPVEGAQDAAGEGTPGFAKRLGRVLLVSFVGSALYALVIGPRSMRGLADGLFIAGAILLLVALSPLIRDILSRTTLPFRLEERSLGDAMDEERDRHQQGETVTYLFGLSGIIVVALSFIISLYVV